MEVVALSRRDDGLDVTREATVEAALAPIEGEMDLILVATGALEIAGAQPEKALKQLDPQALADQYAVNAIGPLMVLKHAQHLLPKERRSVFAALSARVGSIGDNRIGGWYSYRAAKAGLNQLLHTAAIELARSHRQAVVAALHPGTVSTPFTEKYLGRHKAVPAQEAAANLLSVIDGLGPEQTGGFFDWQGEEVVW
jgi:NAD(P)-dependent dehydrogenase (short-subunit alcohol dehydrogenase family)